MKTKLSTYNYNPNKALLQRLKNKHSNLSISLWENGEQERRSRILNKNTYQFPKRKALSCLKTSRGSQRLPLPNLQVPYIIYNILE